jgi:hypothetical protein
MPTGAFATCIAVETFAWATFLIVLAALKIVEFDLYQYTVHFTNWSWTKAAIFFLAVLGFPLSAHRPETLAAMADARRRLREAGDDADDVDTPAADAFCCNVRCAASVVAVCYFPLANIVIFVSAAVFFLLWYNPTLLADVFATMEPGIVIIANDVFHVVPVFALVFFYFIHYHLIWFAVHRTCLAARAVGGVGCQTAYCCYATWCSAVAVYLVYVGVLAALSTSPALVYLDASYDTATYNFVLPIGALVLVGVLVNGIVLLRMCACTPLLQDDRLMARVYEARAMLKEEHELYGDVDDERRAKVRRALRVNLSDRATEAMLTPSAPPPPPPPPPLLPTTRTALGDDNDDARRVVERELVLPSWFESELRRRRAAASTTFTFDV